MKHLIITLFILISSLSANSEIITGEIKYNYQNNQNESFHDQSNKIDSLIIKQHYYDVYNIENLNFLKQGITEFNNRKIAKFSDNTYGIMYYDDPYYYWFYNYNGKLISFTKKDSLEFPTKITKYKIDGTVLNIGYKMSENESYIYSTDGKLLGHWINNQCFNEKNEIIMVRKFIK